MLKFPCLVLDHDDTVVQTERAIGYPFFKKYLDRVRPGNELSFRQYVHDCHDMVFPDMCRLKWNFTDEEQKEEYSIWQEFCKTNLPPAFPGIAEVIRRQKAEGGLVCVVSLSSHANILRDYDALIGIHPDAVYDNDMPREQRKPNPWPLEDLMARFGLEPKDLLMVDDMKLGWMTAHPLGVPIAFAGWSKPEFPELGEEMRNLCDYAFDTPEELYRFLFGAD